MQLFYNEYLGWKAAGGGADSGSAFGSSGSYDLFGRVDLAELVQWPDLAFLLHVKGQYDDSIDPNVGALSDPIDDADFDQAIYVDELWFEQALLGDAVRLRSGFLELQTVFDRNAFANSEDTQFMSTFLDNDPLVPLPNGLGTTLIAAPLPWLEIALGTADADNTPTHAGFDTAFDGLNSLTGYLEVDLDAELPGAAQPLPGSYRFGVFIDGSRKPVFGTTVPGTGMPDTDRGHVGAYLSFDQVAYREDADDAQGLGCFARFAYADPDVNRIAWFWSLGLQYLGLLPGRPADVLGVGFYQAIGSRHYRHAVNPAFHRETGFELYYRIAALPWLMLTPDFQYIIDPGALSSTGNAVVGVMRFRVTF